MGGWSVGSTEDPTTTVPPNTDELAPSRAVRTPGWSGAAGFYGCAGTYSADATVAPSVSAVAASLSSAGRIDLDRDRRLQELHAVEGAPKDRRRVGAQMAAQDLLVHGAKVDRVLEIAGVVQGRQARLGPKQAALDGVADQKQRRRRAVIGAAARVLLRPAPELRPGGDQDLVRHVVRGQILVEGRDRRVEIAHQVVVPAQLRVVRVEAAQGHVQELDAGAGDDQLGSELQRRRQLGLRRVG